VPTERFPFATEAPWSRLLPPALREPPRAVVECNDIGLSARYGPFTVTTPWRNVAGASVTGPFRWFRVIGPRLSLGDRGVTFGTATQAGVCVRFHRPVAALFGRRQVHPGLTVTVADPEGLLAAIGQHTRPTADI
jgi:hypothetical protein